MRYLHTMLRVRNLDTALKFYRDALGMKEVRRIDNDKAKFTLVFLCAPEDEALLSINRPLLIHLLPSPLHQFTAAEDTWSQLQPEPPRRRLRQRLVENPAVFRAELPDDELDVLSRERHELARHLDENFGLVLEVRAEGVLAYDPSGTLTDLDFPGAGSAKQAALLLLDELTMALQPSAESAVLVDGSPLPAALAAWSQVDAVLGELIPGGVSTQITAGQATHILGSITPPGAVEAARCELAAEFTEDLRGIDAAIRETRKKLTVAIRAAGTSLTGLFGVGPVIAAAVIGDVRTVSRFPGRDHFAAYNGTAPIEVKRPGFVGGYDALASGMIIV